MQSVEDLEKDVLGGLLVCKELYVVYDENIYHHLIELQEVAGCFVLYTINILLKELLGTDVKHRFVGITLLGFQAYCMNKMRFTQANGAVNEKRVENYIGDGTGNSRK